MYSKVNYTIVGIFVVMFTIGMAWFAFWLAKYGLQEEYYQYRLEMKESIAGLSRDSSVKLNGVDIGRVSDIRINPKNIEVIEVILDIKKNIPIKKDMLASTVMLGVTGLLSIEIGGGTNGAKTLMPTDEFMPHIKTKNSLLTTLTTNLTGMSEKLDVLLTQSQELLSSKNIQTAGNILTNVEVLTVKGEIVEDKAIVALDEANITLQEFRTSVIIITKQFAQATKDFKQMQKDFSEIKSVSIPMAESIMKTSKNLNRVTLKIEKSLDRGDYSLKKILEPVIIDTQIMVKELSSMSRELGQSPNSLLFKSRESRRGPGE